MNNPFHTLRIALTHENGVFGEPIPFEQIRLIAKAAADCGVRRFALAGGEPLAREDVPILVMMLSSLAMLEEITLTTDGVLLPRWAKALRGAGISRVIVKLDTFDPAKYRTLTGGGDITAVLTGIKTLAEVGFPPATIEARLIRGINDDELPALLRLAKLAGISLRLMELTQAEADAIAPAARMTCEEALALMPALAHDTSAPHIYRLPGAVTLVPCGQRDTGRLVLAADGSLRAGSRSIDMRQMCEEEIRQMIREVMQ